MESWLRKYIDWGCSVCVCLTTTELAIKAPQGRTFSGYGVTALTGLTFASQCKKYRGMT